MGIVAVLALWWETMSWKAVLKSLAASVLLLESKLQ